MSEQELKALRVRIDALDTKVLELISERARCAQEVARVKMKRWRGCSAKSCLRAWPSSSH